MMLRDVINKHPYYDDVDEYYLGLSNESEYEKAASNLLEREFGVDFKITSTQRYRLKIKFSRTIRDFGPKKRRGSGEVVFASKKTQFTDQEAKSTISSVEFAKPNIKRSPEKKTVERKRVLKTQRIIQRSSKKTKKLGKRVDSKKPGKRVDFQKLGLYPAPDFSYQIKSCINYQEGRDSEIKLRIMKQMFQTDMDKHQERFSMPFNQIMDGEEFLNDKEKEEESNGTEVKLVELGLKDGNVHQSTLRLRRRQMNNCISYVLTSNWNDVLDRNKGALKLNDIVQVYSFRRDEKLWLVLTKVIWMQKLKLAMAKGTMRILHGVGANTGSGNQAIVDLRC